MKTPPIDGIRETSPREVSNVESNSWANLEISALHLIERDTFEKGDVSGMEGSMFRLLKASLHQSNDRL